MRSLVWDGDESVNQDWGCTDLRVEPPWLPCKEVGGHFHCGLDIGSPGCKGKPFYAARAGVATSLGWGILGVRTSSGQTDYYIHGSYEVASGQTITQRQRLGVFSDRVPSGGALFAPHLHFEVQAPGGRLNNPASSLDPVPVLVQTFSFEGNSLTPQTTPLRRQIMVALENAVVMFGIGNDNQLYIKRYANPDGPWFGPTVIGTKGSWVDFTAFGDGKRRVDVFARGTSNNEAWHCWSGDSGANFTQWELLGGSFKSQLQAGGPMTLGSQAIASPTDLSPVLAAIASATSELKIAMNNLKLTGGGLTTDQDAHLLAAETAAEQILAHIAAGLQITGMAKA